MSGEWFCISPRMSTAVPGVMVPKRPARAAGSHADALAASAPAGDSLGNSAASGGLRSASQSGVLPTQRPASSSFSCARPRDDIFPVAQESRSAGLRARFVVFPNQARLGAAEARMPSHRPRWHARPKRRGWRTLAIAHHHVGSSLDLGKRLQTIGSSRNDNRPECRETCFPQSLLASRRCSNRWCARPRRRVEFRRRRLYEQSAPAISSHFLSGRVTSICRASSFAGRWLQWA